VVGLRVPEAHYPTVLGGLIADPEDDRANFLPITTPAALERLPAATAQPP